MRKAQCIHQIGTAQFAVANGLKQHFYLIAYLVVYLVGIARLAHSIPQGLQHELDKRRGIGVLIRFGQSRRVRCAHLSTFDGTHSVPYMAVVFSAVRTGAGMSKCPASKWCSQGLCYRRSY